MSKVAVDVMDEKKPKPLSIFGEMKAISDQIRQRAFEIFERRGRSEGSEISDWLDAERDLLRIPEAELMEKNGKFEVTLSAPGFEPGEVSVTALPDALIVKAESTHTHDEREGNVYFCEFGQKTLFRRFDLPEQIDPDKVTADLEKGVLRLSATKAAQISATQAQTPATQEKKKASAA